MPAESEPRLTRIGVPQPQRAVKPGRQQPCAVGRPGAGVNLTSMPAEGEPRLTRVGVPHPQRAVTPGRQQSRAVGGPGAGVNLTFMPAEPAQVRLGGGRQPLLDRQYTVIARRDQCLF